MKFITVNTSTSSRRLFPQTILGKWLWVLGCIVALIPMVMVGLLLTAVAIVAVLVMGVLALVVLVARRMAQKKAVNSPVVQWSKSDGRRNVRVVQRAN